MIFQTFGKMNKTSKKNRVDKCPSTRTIDNNVDKHKNCISNERSHENVDLKNGLMNGLVEGSDTIIADERSLRKIKIKHKSIDITDLKKESDCEKSCTIKNVSTDAENIDQSHPSEKNNFRRDSIVNSININSRGQGEVEKSNGNIFCDENNSFDLSTETLQINQVAASSSECTHHFDCFMNLRDLQLDVTENCVSEVAECMKNIQLKGTLENVSEGTETEQDEHCHPNPVIHFIQYESELQMPMIMKIIQKDLSEPYSIYTYRYFIHNWPKLCFLALCEGECVGAIVCKLDVHRKVIKRGYIAMLAVDEKFRKLRIGSNLVQKAINEMIQGDADEVVLETEITNKPALQLYEKLGFVRDKRLFRYYLNGVDALRLKLWLR